MFDRRRDPIAHLKDYCGRVVGIGYNEALQSLSGMELAWFAQQDFNKWHKWKDMA